MEQRKAGRTYPFIFSVSQQKDRKMEGRPVVGELPITLQSSQKVCRSMCLLCGQCHREQEKDLFVQQDKKSQCFSRPWKK